MNTDDTITPKISAKLPKTPRALWASLTGATLINGWAATSNVLRLIHRDDALWLSGFFLILQGAILIFLCNGMYDSWRYDRYVRGVERKIAAELQDLVDKATTISPTPTKSKKGN